MTTPAENGESVELLRKRFHLGEALWVPSLPRNDSIVQDCYKDVERQVTDFGGAIVYGWEIWEWPRIMIEGEFHAVWKSPDSELIDVTAKPDGEKTILFIPDPSRVYESRQIDNIRLALWDHNLVHDFIQVSEDLFRLFDEGRVSELASIVDSDEQERLEYRKAAIQKKLMSFPRARIAF